MQKLQKIIAILVIITSGLILGSCQTLREIANLSRVNFELSRVSEALLAGVDVARIRSYEDLNTLDLARITAAIARGDLPLSFTLHLNAENPESNRVQARLVQMDWTLFLEDRETVSGLFDEAILLPPGESRDIPIDIQLDLYDFFERNARDLIELVLAVSGQGGAPKQIELQATPIIETPIGPIRYPTPITITSREVGN